LAIESREDPSKGKDLQLNSQVSSKHLWITVMNGGFGGSIYRGVLEGVKRQAATPVPPDFLLIPHKALQLGMNSN